MSLLKGHHQPEPRLQVVYHKVLCWVHYCLSSSLTICLMKSNIIYVNFLLVIVNCTVLIMMTRLTKCKWQLPFNAAKCKVMHFGYSNPKRTYEMNVILETCDNEKDLGAIIEDSLKFHVHTAAAIKKDRSSVWNDEESI